MARTGSDGADLKEDGLPVHPPEVGDGVTAVAATGQQLQGGVAAGTQLLWKAGGSEAGGRRQRNAWRNLLCCFCRALSQMAGRSCSREPSARPQPREQTTTPRHDFFRIWQLWLLVFLMAHPDRCLWAFLSSARSTRTLSRRQRLARRSGGDITVSHLRQPCQRSHRCR